MNYIFGFHVKEAIFIVGRSNVGSKTFSFVGHLSVRHLIVNCILIFLILGEK